MKYLFLYIVCICQTKHLARAIQGRNGLILLRVSEDSVRDQLAFMQKYHSKRHGEASFLYRGGQKVKERGRQSEGDTASSGYSLQ